MASIHDIYGVSNLEIGDPGDGIMGTSLSSFTNIEKGSATIKMPTPETVDIYTETEQVTPYRSIPQQSEGATIEVSLYGVALADYEKFFGGTYTSGTKTWAAPKSLTSIYKSVKLTTKETSATTKLAIQMPYALVTAGIEGAITNDSIATVKLSFKAQIPISTGGVKGDPLSILEVAV